MIPLDVLADALPYSGAGDLEAEHVINALAEAGWMIVRANYVLNAKEQAEAIARCRDIPESEIEAVLNAHLRLIHENRFDLMERLQIVGYMYRAIAMRERCVQLLQERQVACQNNS